MAKKTCLITGGAGFIGSTLAEALIQKGYSVRILDNFTTGRLENLAAIQNDISLYEGDIRNIALVQTACQDVDYVFHEAAIASVQYCLQHPDEGHAVNVTGTLNVLEAAKQAGVKQVLFASSAAVYGSSAESVKTEGLLPTPTSHYGLGKHIGEQYAKLYSELSEMTVTCFRYFNVFGPKQLRDSSYSGVISIFVNALLSGQTPTIYGDGGQTRDFVHVEDIVRANITAIETDCPKFGIFNVACGKQYSVLEILNWLIDFLQVDVTPRFAEERRSDLRHSLASITQIASTLGFTPQKAFFDGLKEFVRYTQENHFLSQCQPLPLNPGVPRPIWTPATQTTTA